MSAGLGSLCLLHLQLPVALPGRLGEIVYLFPAGMVLFKMSRQIPIGLGGPLTYVGAILFALAVNMNVDALFYASFIALILGLSYDDGFVSRVLSSRVAVFGGSISYAIYMTHEVLHKAVTELLGRLVITTPTAARVALMSVMLALVLVAWAAHVWIEVPCARRLRQIGQKRLGGGYEARYTTAGNPMG